ncbi:MAG: DeoR family transcriptional regulator [bacterium]|nr:DeoR family transcriptional regulator [bacterium]
MRNHAQKITEALYRITDIFPDREPLKWYLREEGLLIFEMFLKIEDAGVYDRIKYIDRIEKIIPHMTHALGLASLGTFISRTNFEVLSKEYSALFNFIKDKKDELLPESAKQLSMRSLEEILKDNNAELDKQKKEKDSFLPKRNNEDNLKDIFQKKNENNSSTQYFSQSVNKDHSDSSSYGKPKTNNARQSEKENHEYVSVGGDSGRKEKIVSIIRERGEVSAGDVAAYFAGISGKTIQRDLISLAGDGVVKKHGDKRWRRYALTVD